MKIMLSNFLKLKEKYITLRNKYKDSFDELNKSVNENINRIEYAKGGLLLHRGYFSPSHSDIFTGGVKRGRLLTKKSKSYDYEYIFDSSNRLICTKKYVRDNGLNTIYDIEFLIYQDSYVLSLIYNCFNCQELYIITECFYENEKLNKYVNGLFCNDDIEIVIEDLEYVEDKMHCLWLTNYLSLCNLITQSKYEFSYLENDIVSYTAVQTFPKLDNTQNITYYV